MGIFSGNLDLGFLALGLEGSALQKIDLKAPLGVEVCGELDVNRILIDRLEVFEHPGHDGRKIRPGQQFVESQDPDVLPGVARRPHLLRGFFVPHADQVESGLDPFMDDLHQGKGVKPVVFEIQEVHVVLREAPGVGDAAV